MPVTSYHSIGDELLGETTGALRTDYVPDALGSVAATTANVANGVASSFERKPYGDLLARSGSLPDPYYSYVGTLGYRQTGRRFASHYARARHYDAVTGTWISVDPLWPAEPAYHYVDGNPTTWIDPSGLRGALGGARMPRGGGFRPGGGSRRGGGGGRGGGNGRGSGGGRGRGGGRNSGGQWVPYPGGFPPGLYPPPPTQIPRNPRLPCDPITNPIRYPYYEPIQYWPIPLPKPFQYPRLSPRYINPADPPADPCSALADKKNANCHQPGKKGGPPNQSCKLPDGDPNKVTPDICKKWRDLAPYRKACCEAREDELTWRCLPPEEIYGHDKQRIECDNMSKNCDKNIARYCR